MVKDNKGKSGQVLIIIYRFFRIAICIFSSVRKKRRRKVTEAGGGRSRRKQMWALLIFKNPQSVEYFRKFYGVIGNLILSSHRHRMGLQDKTHVRCSKQDGINKGAPWCDWNLEHLN